MTAIIGQKLSASHTLGTRYVVRTVKQGRVVRVKEVVNGFEYVELEGHDPRLFQRRPELRQ